MNMVGLLMLKTIAVLIPVEASAGEDVPAANGPPPVPVTRTELKQFLENSKRSRPRLPLPPLTEEEKQKAEKGDWSVVNNGRMRKYYLPAELVPAGFTREPDPAMKLGHDFQTRLFWIVSRANNCPYCMGHQESKLSAVGLSDDEIAALDGDWTEASEAHRAAYALTQKLTRNPHLVDAADIDRLRPHYRDAEILEILTSVAGFNAMNRWTAALAIPQEDHRVYLSPTAPKYRDLVSLVAPINASSAGENDTKLVRAVPARRPELESRVEVERALEAARNRQSRLPLLDDSAARAVLSPDWPSGPLPAWVRLLAAFPKAGLARINLHRAAQEKGHLSPRLKAEIAWVAARNDRSWYALDLARKQLRALGCSDDEIFRLDERDSSLSAAERQTLALTRKLTVDPALVADADIEALRQQASDKDVAEIIFQISETAYFDRLTEAAGLTLEK